MRHFLFILSSVIAIVHYVKSDDLKCKNATKSMQRRLKDHLFCEYDGYVRPTVNGNQETPTEVDVRLLPQYVEFTEEKNLLNLHTWVAMSWKDPHLTWEPSRWDNIKEIHVNSYSIWKPELTVFNSGEMTDNDAGVGYTDCLLHYDGDLKCVSPTKYTSHCPTDYSEWPYDKHNCTMQIGAWMFYHNEITLTFETDAIMMASFMENKEWNIHIDNQPPEYIKRMRDDSELTIFITVMLQRHATRLAIIYIVPAIVLMILTLVVLWLDSQSLERIFVACINFICHILGIFDLHWYFPSSGSEKTPKILVFYETSVGLASAALVLTCLLRKLRDTNVPAPMFLVTITSIILNSPVGTLLKINLTEHKKDVGLLDDPESNEQSSNATVKNRTWLELSLIIEWFSFVIIFLIYIILIATLLPPAPPKEADHLYWL